MMAQKIHYNWPDIYIERHNNIGTGCVIKVDFSRIEKQFQKAQKSLDLRVMQDMEKFMPKESGTFIQVTQGMSKAIAGSGKVIAAAPPTGRFLYYGKVMVDPVTNSPWAQKGAKKVLTNRSIVYSKSANPQAQAKWFEPAKKQYGKEWVDIVKEEAGGGKR